MLRYLWFTRYLAKIKIKSYFKLFLTSLKHCPDRGLFKNGPRFTVAALVYDYVDVIYLDL